MTEIKNITSICFKTCFIVAAWLLLMGVLGSLGMDLLTYSLLLGFLIFFQNRRQDLRGFPLTPYYKHSFWGYLALALGFKALVISGVYFFIGDQFNPVPDKALSVKLAGFLFIPAIEEIIFRGFILKYVSKATNSRVGLIIQAVAFAIPHILIEQGVGFNIAKISSIFIVGLFYGWLAQKEKNLFFPIAIHSINNFIAFFVF